MKFYKIIILPFLIISNLSFGQSGQLIGHVALSDSSQISNTIFARLKLKDSIISISLIDSTGTFKFKNIKSTTYSVIITQIGYRDFVVDHVAILEDSVTYLNFTYPGPCKFVYQKGSKPRCIGGHTDNIIPIVYGLPGSKTMEKARKGKIHLGGCLVTDCDPKYYCKIHQVEL